MKCPNCAAPSAEDAAECPKCGLVFAKWRERREKEKLRTDEALRLLDSKEPRDKPNPWTGRLLAALVVAWWMLGLAVYYLHELRRVSGRGN